MGTSVRVLVASALLSCGSSGGALVRPSATAPTPTASAMPAPVKAPPNTLFRSAVHAVVSQGLGAFLQRVEVDDHPVLLGGKFHGFRIAALRGGAFWSGVDLRAGDVVTSLNGMPIEHPEQAQTAFDSLEVASELRVTYERDGERREIVYAIAEDR